MDTVQKLKEDRAKVWDAQKAINDKSAAEKRSLTAEEKTAWDAADVEFNRLTDEIKQAETAILAEEQRKTEFEKRQALMNNPASKATHIPVDAGHMVNLVAMNKDDRMFNALRAYRAATNNRYATKEYESAYRSFLVAGLGSQSVVTPAELRALQADSDTAGGFLVVPEQFVNKLIQAKDRMVFVRRYATVIPVPNAASLGVPDLANDPAAPTWTAEILTGTADSTMSLAKRELHPHPLAKRIKVSKKLIRVASMNVESLVRDRLAYKQAVTEENIFLNGTGSNQPLGVFTSSADGVTSARDVSTGNGTTTLVADNLINVKYSLEAQYRANCRWMFHRDVIKYIRKLKDGESNYIWRPGIAADAPDTILDIPFDESEYAPSTFSSGSYLGILGDWSFYWIADALNMQIQVLTELYAETNQNGYIIRSETDGAPVHAAAFARVKLA